MSMLPDDYDLPVYEGPTVEFLIRYRHDREDAALLFARRLFAELDYRIGSLTLTPVDDDEFDVWLDGQRVHSLAESGADPSAVATTRLAWSRLART